MFMEGLDSVYDEDLGLDAVEETVEEDIFDFSSTKEDIFEEKINLNPEESIVSDFLKSKGIKDNKIIMLDESNKEEKIDFFSLSKEDQLEVLKSTEEAKDDSYDLDNSEIEFLNKLRTDNTSVEQYLAAYKETILAEAKTNLEPSYDIDAYTDEELFILDLKNKYDLTNEELEAELEKELQNKDLFTKKVTKTREEYKKLEDNYKEEQEQAFQSQKQEEYQGFVNTMVNVATKTPELFGIQLEDDEKNEVLSLLLDLDDKGASDFYKQLNNPATLYQAAWFLRYGKEAFDSIIDAYEAEIAKLEKGKIKDTTKVLIKQDTNLNNIHNLFD